jgi:hypothetical protein
MQYVKIGITTILRVECKGLYINSVKSLPFLLSVKSMVALFLRIEELILKLSTL